MTVREFKLPDPGEGLTEAEIVTWRVGVGDTVKVNDVVVEIETAKSLVELPVPFAGTVTALLVDEGQTVEVGTPIIAVDDGVAGTRGAIAPGDESAAAAVAAEPVAAAGQAERAETGAAVEPPEGAGAVATQEGDPKRTPVLVGYGVKPTEAKRRPRRKDHLKRTVAAPPAEHRDAPPSARVGGLVAAHAPDVPRDVRPVADLARPHGTHPDRVRALAKPAVRRVARDLGVELTEVTGSGEGGIITHADVLAHVGDGGAAGGTPHTGALAPGGWEREERIPVKGVRKLTAEAMVASAFSAPHVTEWVTCDVTATMDLVERLRQDAEFDGVKVTPLLVLAKAMCMAVRRNPGINASWDEQRQEIVVKNYVNLGIAAATPRGLVVPNVKGADRMSLRELAGAIGSLTATAREGRTPPADMAGGTITITNIGVFGIDAGTPILNPGEAAILALGAVQRRPWVVGAGADERIEPRWVTTLAMSFDHRLVDGELGSRYLADVAAILTDPARGLVWG